MLKSLLEFKMPPEIWKLEGDLCRCCHSEGNFTNLAEPREQIDHKEVYCDMLKECFDLNINPVPSLLCEQTYTICEACILRLKDAFDFKLQVQKCEAKFKDFFNRNAIIAAKVGKEEVKDEVPELILDIKDDYSDNYDNVDDNDIIMLNSEEPIKTVQKPKEETGEMEKSKPKVRTRTNNTGLRQKKSEREGKKEQKEKKKGASKGGKTARKFRLLSQDFKMDGGTYVCGHCDKRYDKTCSLRFHLKTKHYKIPRYFCELCQMEFMTHAPFTVHKLEVHSIDERFKCNACKGMFNSKVQLKKHMNNFHMMGEKHKCDYCDYESFSFEGLYKHKFKHKTVKDYHCRFCRKSFLRKATLDLHERIHTGDRRKVCQVCSQAFVQKASLNYHMTKYHPEVNF